MSDKKFGSIKVKTRVEFFYEERARFAFNMRGSPKVTTPITEFYKDLLNAIDFVMAQYATLLEDTQRDLLNELQEDIV
jgi:hypothetical protein